MYDYVGRNLYRIDANPRDMQKVLREIRSIVPDSWPGKYGDIYICNMIEEEGRMAEISIRGLKLTEMNAEEELQYAGTDTDAFRY